LEGPKITRKTERSTLVFRIKVSSVLHSVHRAVSYSVAGHCLAKPHQVAVAVTQHQLETCMKSMAICYERCLEAGLALFASCKGTHNKHMHPLAGGACMTAICLCEVYVCVRHHLGCRLFVRGTANIASCPPYIARFRTMVLCSCPSGPAPGPCQMGPAACWCVPVINALCFLHLLLRGEQSQQLIRRPHPALICPAPPCHFACPALPRAVHRMPCPAPPCHAPPCPAMP
jgi:hypothetical protein